MLQAAGHSGTLKEDAAAAGFILKPYDATEAINYEALWKIEDDPLQPYIARWGGKVEVQVGSAESGNSQPFMRLGNLLESFKKPCVMDCKMGVRTFQQKEAKKKELRKDFYEKLNAMNPELLTEEDHKAGAITKFKWTQSRDAVSTSKPLGFRVDGIVSEQGARVQKKVLDGFGSREEVLQVLPRVLPLHAMTAGDKEAINKQRVTLVRQIVMQLEGIREAMECSEFFKSHEFVGSSLLFVVDDNQARVHLIDLAKTESLPEGVRISHRSTWEMGNHEDGMLFGVDSLIDCWRTSLDWLEGKTRRRSINNDMSNSYGEFDMEELENQLHIHGVDTTTWGLGGAKAVIELYSEINEERAVTFEVADDGRFFRVINVVKAWILVDLPNGETVALVEPKKRRKFSQDTSWAEKSVKGKPMQKKVSEDQQWQDTLTEAIKERLAIPPESQTELFDWLWDTYKMSIDTRQGTPNDGYDGLWSVYRIHEIDIRVKDSRDPRLAPLGLPDGADFTAVQTAGLHSAFGHRQHSWKWQPISEAGYVAREADKQDAGAASEAAMCGTKTVVLRKSFALHGNSRGGLPGVDTDGMLSESVAGFQSRRAPECCSGIERSCVLL